MEGEPRKNKKNKAAAEKRRRRRRRRVRRIQKDKIRRHAAELAKRTKK